MTIDQALAAIEQRAGHPLLSITEAEACLGDIPRLVNALRIAVARLDDIKCGIYEAHRHCDETLSQIEAALNGE